MSLDVLLQKHNILISTISIGVLVVLSSKRHMDSSTR